MSFSEELKILSLRMEAHEVLHRLYKEHYEKQVSYTKEILKELEDEVKCCETYDELREALNGFLERLIH